MTAKAISDQRLPIRWRIRRSIQLPMQRLLMIMADYMNFFLVRGLEPRGQIEVRRFLKAPMFSIATDYVRNATLELICRDIREHQVSGAVAELGVYQGDFALLMHSHLAERPIHLFDTFQGFDTRDVSADADQAYVDEFPDFTGTSAARVASRFDKQADVVLHPGWFPASAEGSGNEQFALVSIDTDLYQPIFTGLQWFWPRLNAGGCILVHDYNNASFKGAKAAVLDFLKMTPAVTCCPIPDVGGTAIIRKPLLVPSVSV